ncbi:hypothetical protein UFOVP731_31 [uncultured Caudovirales phage]|uniref:Uncharacterized protein n=1 Tax=uncultured Caudovirales phage TaxID=2100421 RepID=A0A6J5NVD2_9CAUD|nr:hypothetical protein UFOVP731_31 [uncultured Caudovirales phage]
MLTLFSILMCGFQEIKFPVEISGNTGEFIAIRGECTGKSIRYYAIDSGISVFPASLLSDPKATVVTSTNPGKYRILAYTCFNDVPSEPVVVTVFIGQKRLESDFSKEMQVIWNGTKEEGKEANKQKLVSLYKKISEICLDQEFMTVSQLFQAAVKEANASIPSDCLSSLRDRVAQEVKLVLTSDPDKVITGTMRVDASQVYKKASQILEELK